MEKVLESEVGILLPARFFDSLMGQINDNEYYENDGYCHASKRLNGRPVLTWVSQSFLRSSAYRKVKLYIIENRGGGNK